MMNVFWWVFFWGGGGFWSGVVSIVNHCSLGCHSVSKFRPCVVCEDCVGRQLGWLEGRGYKRRAGITRGTLRS